MAFCWPTGIVSVHCALCGKILACGHSGSCVLAHFLMLAHICSRLIAELSACDRACPTRPEAAQWYATNADPFSLTWPAGGSNMQAWLTIRVGGSWEASWSTPLSLRSPQLKFCSLPPPLFHSRSHFYRCVRANLVPTQHLLGLWCRDGFRWAAS
jgi:hypothetical protein